MKALDERKMQEAKKEKQTKAEWSKGNRSYSERVNSFHNDIEKIKSNLIKNAYPPFLINKVFKTYLDYKFSSNQNQLKDISDVHCFKLPYIGNLSHHIKNKLSKHSKEFCK